MMKNITLILFLVFGFVASAQNYYYLPPAPGNPGGLNTDVEYPVGSGLDPSWTSILPGSQPATGTWTTTQSIPFAFNFNGIPVTQFKVNSNGVLTFDVASSATIPQTPAVIPSASIPDNSIMVWGITGTGASDQITVKTFGTSPNRQHWIFFTSYTMPGAASSWTYWSIVLEESSNAIYIVDQRNANGTLSATLGVQISSTLAYSVAGSPNVGCLSGASETSSDNFYYAFLPGPQPQFDMKGEKVTTNSLLYTSKAPFTIKGEFYNQGAATITSADINYKIDGGATVTSNLTGLNIASNAKVELSSPTKWSNGSVGVHTVEVWLSNLNGNADLNTVNDKVSKSVEIIQGIERFSLYETFTSSTCAPCTPANTNMEAIFGDNPNHVSLKYQMSWPGTGDPYYTTEGNARRTYYSVNSVPNVAIDGGWNNNGNSLTQAIYTSYKKVSTTVEMEALYSISGQTVYVDVMINPTANISASDLTLHVAIKEKLTTQNIKTNGETEFHNVMKKMVPNENGTNISGLVSGNQVKYSFSYTFNGNFRLPNNASDPINHATEHSVEEFSDLAVAVWLQSAGTKQVYQAAEAAQVLSIDDYNTQPFGLLVYPNPAKDFTSVNIDMTKNAVANISVVNALGQTVMNVSESLVSGNNKVNLTTDGLTAGMYFVIVDIDGSTQTVKLTVQ